MAKAPRCEASALFFCACHLTGSALPLRWCKSRERKGRYETMWMVYALAAAVCFGVRGILYHWSSQRPIDRNLMLFGVFFSGAVVSLAAAAWTGQRWSAASALGAVMGTCSFVANASMLKGFAVGKASLVSVLTGLPAVVVAALAFAFWGETLTGWQLASLGLITCGVVALRYSNDISLKHLQGAGWGLLATLFFALNDVTAKQTTRLEADVLPTLFFMFATGALWFGASWRIGLRRAASLESAAASEAGLAAAWSRRRTFLWGMAVGLTNVFGMILIWLGFKYGVTGLVSAVVALNVLLILVYARIFAKETFKRLEAAGIVLALAGVLLLQLAA